MFRTAPATLKGEQTRAAILACALELFRERGFDSTTMREIATRANAALGAAYYYFSGKEAIVQAYYDQVQSEHHRRVTESLASGTLDLKDRLRAALHTKLDVVQNDRRLLGALFRYSGEPDHALSCFGAATAGTRRQSITTFALVVGDEKLPNDLREILPVGFWALHLGILLYFLYDRSPEQARTRKLVDGVCALVASMVTLTKSALLKPVRGRLTALVREAGLVEAEHLAAPEFQEEQP